MNSQTIYRLANDDRLDDGLNRIIAQGPSQPGNGRFLFVVGAAGMGKTSAAKRVMRERTVPLISLRATSTVRSALSELAYASTGFHVAERGVDALALRCADECRERRVPFVLVDEGDVLNQAPRFVLFNTLRWLADASGTAIVIFSTAALMLRFAVPTPYLEQISSRTVAQVEFKRPTLADAAKLAELVESVQIERDLVRLLFEGARASIRPLLNLYEQIETAARAAKITGSLNLARAVKLGLVVEPDRHVEDEPTSSVSERKAAVG